MFSITVRCGKRLNCWNTMPTFSRSVLSDARSGPRAGILVAFGRERSIDPDRAALNRLERGEATQKRALPGAARPDDDQDLTCAELETDVGQDGGDSVTLDQPVDDDERLRDHHA
jgi:hypothetical protein